MLLEGGTGDEVKFKCFVQVKKIQGLKCWVTGTITLPGSSTILASCEAQLANMAPILKAQLEG